MIDPMRASENAFDIITRFEGLRTKAYRCPSGLWTIGYGHTDGVRQGDYCTEDQAEEYLKCDISEAEDAIVSWTDVPLSQNQFDALVSFVFNVGVSAFVRSTLRKVLNNGQYDKVPEQLMRWTHGGQGGKRVVLNGLVRRRKAECELWNR